MKKTLILRKNILINNAEVSELTYDIEEIDGNKFLEAEGLSQQMVGDMVKFSFMEADNVLHTYLGYAAITAVNPHIDMLDLKQIKGYDNVAINRIGRDFITGASEDTSEENASESSIEVIPESIIPESENLSEDDC